MKIKRIIIIKRCFLVYIAESGREGFTKARDDETASWEPSRMKFKCEKFIFLKKRMCDDVVDGCESE